MDLGIIAKACHQYRGILALVEIYGPDQVTRAIQDAHEYHAYSCEYVANIIEQRQRKLPEPAALHLTRSADLLELEQPEPDLSVYDPKPTLSETNPSNE